MTFRRPEAFLDMVREGKDIDAEGNGWMKKVGWAVNCLHQMRSEIPSLNIAAAVATGGVIADAERDDHAWMVCQGDGGANSEPVLDNDIKVCALLISCEHRFSKRLSCEKLVPPADVRGDDHFCL
jgi:hypothetical protein